MVNEDSLRAVVSILSDYSGKLYKDDIEFIGEQLKDQSSILETFFDKYFEVFEGPACSHDKSHFVTKKIINTLKTGKNEKLTMTYGEYKDSGHDIGNISELDQICYWCPKTLSSTEDAVKLFYNFINFDFKQIQKLMKGDK